MQVYYDEGIVMQYTDFSLARINVLAQSVNVLVITATNIETETLHLNLTPLSGMPKMCRIHKDAHTYYIGMLGAYPIVHVQCDMGSIGRDSAIATVIDSIDTWSPKAVVMVGIAFGVNAVTQNVGDVLVAESVLPYDSKKVGPKSTEYRGPRPQAGSILLNRFKNAKSWRHKIDDSDANCFFGSILTGETLIDNETFRDQLCTVFPTAKGGEMEGAGIYTAAESRKVEWIIVKGICDFADGNKSSNKGKYQRIAAESAVSLCLHVFSDQYAFDALGIDCYKTGSTNNCVSVESEIVPLVLFTVYSPDKESFYFVREHDQHFERILKLNGVWVSGPCGTGKTNLILRNLFKTDIPFLMVDLASAVGRRGDLLMHSVYTTIKESLYLKGLRVVCNESDTGNLLDNIAYMLDKSVGSQDMVIYLDEIPIDIGQEFEQFIEKMFAIQIKIRNANPSSKIRFVFATITEPAMLIKPHQKKIYEVLKFIHLGKWDAKDLEALFSDIADNLGLSFDKEVKYKVLSAGNGTPRYVKNFFKNFLMLASWSIDRVIAETKAEVQI